MFALRKWAKFELCGLLLILFATWWQFFITDQQNDTIQDIKLYKIERKVDAVWDYLEHAIYLSDKNALGEKYNEIRRYYCYPLYNLGGTAVVQNNKLMFIKNSLFILGSVLLLIGRYLEVKEGKISNYQS